jgi:exopolysaccharide biosynthesis polyprenyl glycosylphosphotransferase
MYAMTTVEAVTTAGTISGFGQSGLLTAPRLLDPPRAFDAPRTLEATPTVVAPRAMPALERRQLWERKYRARLRLTDSVVVIAAAGVAAWLQIATVAQVDLRDAPLQYGRVFMITASIWLLSLAVMQTRASRVVGHGMAEYRRVAHATGMAFGVLAIAFVLLQSQGIRTQLLVALPLGGMSLLVGRWVNRRWLVRQRQAGKFMSQAVVIGRRSDVEYVIRSVHRDDLLGYRVVGVALDDDDTPRIVVGDESFQALGSIDSVASVAANLGADAVIVASTPANDSEFLKRLSWQLEGTAAELVLSSPLADVAGPRMTLKPVEGLPLIQVALPTFEGGRYVLKRALDIVVASLALLGIALVTPFIALAIKLDSPGPVFFRQQRVGRDGRQFYMVKFRSMGVDAEERKAHLIALNEGSGPLFKLKSDPRVTRVGAFLRKFSLDELPQFWNVLVGDMSVVGPRPPLLSETRAYGSSTYRRLFIRPGITGPWQVGGRSLLSWDESVRLDLRYVENWSVIGDIVIMWRTFVTMIKPEGAF